MGDPQLHLVNTDTGEVYPESERDRRLDELETLAEQQARDLQTKNLQIGKLRKELREFRLAEPETEAVRGVLEYWRERCKPRAVIAIGGKRWEKVRARMRDRFDDRPPWTPEELRLAVDGALLDPWLSGTAKGSKGYLDAETVFRDAEMVERLRDLAIGFQGKAGIPLADLLDLLPELRTVHWKDLLPICLCDHRRMEHAFREDGHEACRICDCEDYDRDVLDPFNWKLDPHLKRLMEAA